MSMNSRGSVVVKLWESVGYSASPQNCGNCKCADHVDWDDNHPVCPVLGKLQFPITRHGICRLHSSFNHGVKYCV